jgi:hypothetical protein
MLDTSHSELFLLPLCVYFKISERSVSYLLQENIIKYSWLFQGRKLDVTMEA